jgi:hypothetical protein
MADADGSMMKAAPRNKISYENRVIMTGVVGKGEDFGLNPVVCRVAAGIELAVTRHGVV